MPGCVSARCARADRQTQEALLLLFYATGHMPTGALVLCGLATAHHLYVLAPEHWPARAEGRGGVRALAPARAYR